MTPDPHTHVHACAHNHILIIEESDSDQAQEWLEESSLAYLGLKTILFPFKTEKNTSVTESGCPGMNKMYTPLSHLPHHFNSDSEIFQFRHTHCWSWSCSHGDVCHLEYPSLLDAGLLEGRLQPGQHGQFSLEELSLSTECFLLPNFHMSVCVYVCAHICLQTCTPV